MRVSIGIVIAVALIVYWYMQDHRAPAPPVKQGQSHEIFIGVV
jgi:hypothetical protein